jgi:hypothetical protein
MMSSVVHMLFFMCAVRQGVGCEGRRTRSALNRHQQQQKQCHLKVSNQEWGGSQNHQNGNETPETLMSILADYYFLHFWYLECLCIGGARRRTLKSDLLHFSDGCLIITKRDVTGWLCCVTPCWLLGWYD